MQIKNTVQEPLIRHREYSLSTPSAWTLFVDSCHRTYDVHGRGPKMLLWSWPYELTEDTIRGLRQALTTGSGRVPTPDSLFDRHLTVRAEDGQMTLSLPFGGTPDDQFHTQPLVISIPIAWQLLADLTHLVEGGTWQDFPDALELAPATIAAPLAEQLFATRR